MLLWCLLCVFSANSSGVGTDCRARAPSPTSTSAVWQNTLVKQTGFSRKLEMLTTVPRESFLSEQTLPTGFGFVLFCFFLTAAMGFEKRGQRKQKPVAL